METFIGDSSLNGYIANSLCAVSNSNNQNFQTGIVLVNRFVLNSSSTKLKSNLLSKTLISNCDSVVINLSQQLTSTKLLEHCQSTTFRRYSALQMIFDLGNLRSYSVFSQVMFALSEVYQQCLNCQPLILLFEDSEKGGTSTSTFARWISGLLRKVPELFRGFRAVLTSSATSEKDVLHLNPILDGCLEYSGVFLPRSVADFARLSAKRCNLYSGVLGVSISRLQPYCDFTRNQNGSLTVHYGMETELLQTLAQKFNFRPSFVDGRQNWGSLLNGSWGGMMGQVLNYTSHLAMCEYTITPSRQRAIDFSRFILQNEITFISPSPGVKERPWIVAAPFGVRLWAIILATIISLSTVSWLLHRYSPRLASESFMDIISDIYCVPLQESTFLNQKEKHGAMRLIIGIWIFCALTLSTSYSSAFYSILTVPEFELPVDTVEDIRLLASSDSKYLLVKENSSNWLNFIGAGRENRVYHTIGVHLNRTGVRFTTTLADVMSRLEEPSARYVILANRIVLRIYRHQYANRSLHIGRENLGIELTGYIFRKRSPLRPYFNAMILRFREMALVERWVGKAFFRLKKRSSTGSSSELVSTANENSGDIDPFNVNDLSSIFILWFIGIGSSLAGFLLEYVAHLWQKRSF